MPKSIKSVFNLVFLIGCILLGLTEINKTGESFTSQTLVETILFIGPILYFISKSLSSEVITKYRDLGYSPKKFKRTLDDIYVTMNTVIIQPICLDFVYSSFFLLLLKWIAPEQLGSVANVVYSIYLFNKKVFKTPLAMLILVVSILTLLNILSHTALKRLKNIKKTVGIPLKLVTTLLFFVNIDTGISGKYISWKINQDHPTSAGTNVTFNATSAQEEEVKEIIKAYVDVMFHHLPTPDQISDSDYSCRELYEALEKIKGDRSKDEKILKDLYDGRAGATKSLENKDEVEGLLKRDKDPAERSTEFKSTNLYDAAYTNATHPLKKLYDILTDERKSIHDKVESPSQSILKDVIGEFIGKTYFFKSLPGKIPFYAFATDKLFDDIKNKFATGFASLVKKANDGYLHKFDLGVVGDYIKSQCSKTYNAGVELIKKTKGEIVVLSKQYDEAIQLKARMKAKLTSNKKNDDDLALYADKFPHDEISIDFEKNLSENPERVKLSSKIRQALVLRNRGEKGTSPVEHIIKERVEDIKRPARRAR